MRFKVSELKKFVKYPYLLPYHIKHKLGLKPSEKQLLTVQYFNFNRKKLNIKHPITFNDKLNWLKLHQTDPRLSDLVDKVKVKDIIGNVIGQEHIIQTYGVWKAADEIDYDILPDKFVIKTNHDSGSYAVCRSKATFDFAKAADKMTASLNHDYSQRFLEKPYKFVERRILAEQFLENNPQEDPDPTRWERIKFHAPEFGKRYADIPKEANADIVHFAREICEKHPLTTADFFSDQDGNRYSKLILNTPPMTICQIYINIWTTSRIGTLFVIPPTR